MALVGTISGSNGTSNTAVTGTLVIANTTANFPSIASDSVLFVSGAIAGTTSKAVFGGDVIISGNLATNNGNLTTTATTYNLVNAAATTINFGGGANVRINMGNSAGQIWSSGSAKFPQGISGSLTQLTDGSSAFVAGTNVQVTSASNGAVTFASNNIPVSFFGDASDGTVTLDGVAVPAWATLAGSVYTMTRDAYLRNLTVNATITLRLAGFLPFVKGTLTNNGTIETRGNDATGATAGASITTQGAWGYTAGGGGNGAGPSTSGSTGFNGAGAGGQSIGGGGGNGGAVGAFAAGTGNTTVAPTAANGGWRDAGFFVRRRIFNGVAHLTLNGSGGGGGGAASGSAPDTATGGGGGGGAVNCYVFCDTLNNAGTIQSVGGAGANGSVTGAIAKAGGGGGGSGGGVIVAANTVTALGTIQSVGGAFGNGANGGANGSGGTAGTVLVLTGS